MLPIPITCLTSDDVIDNMVTTSDTNIVEESLPVLSHGNSEISLEASYPEFYSEIIDSNNIEEEKVKLLKSITGSQHA